jgi:hypothetical protein
VDTETTSARKGVAVAPQPDSPTRVRLTAGSRRLGRTALTRLLDSELFVAATPSRPTWRRVVLAVAAVLGGAALNLTRVRGPGPFNSIAAEDGFIFLNQALADSFWAALLTSINGYWAVVPRLLTELALLAPLPWVPAVLTILAALVMALVAALAYAASGAYFTHPALRLLVSVPVLVVPAGGSWMESNVATLQFALLYGLFWALLWVPATRWGRAAATVAVAGTALSTPLAVVFVPLALFRLLKRRDLHGWVMAVVLAAGSAAHFIGGALGYATREGIGTPRLDPTWAVYQYLAKTVPVAVLGQNWLFDKAADHATFCATYVVDHKFEHRLLIVVANLIVIALAAIAALRGRPAWALAVVAFGHSFAVHALSTMSLGCTNTRYWIAPTMLALPGFAALLRPKDPATMEGRSRGRLHAAAVAFLTLTTIVCVANLRTDGPRTTESPPWTSLLADARNQCRNPLEEAAEIKIDDFWPVTIPCDLVRAEIR